MKYLDLLGFKVKDRVTGFEGVAEAVSYELYGCIQVVVRGQTDRKNEDVARWFDAKRVMKTSEEPVMTPPSFAEPEAGAAEKPLRAELEARS